MKTFTRLSVRETELSLSGGETEERTACPITKASNNAHFHISLIFVLYFHSQFQRFFSLFDAFSHPRNFERVQRRVTVPQGTCFVRSTKLSPARRGYTWMGDQIPRVVIICFFPLFSPFLIPRRYLRLQNCHPCVIPVLLFVNFLFLVSPWPYLCVFICIIVYINSGTRRSNCPQLQNS